MSGEFRNVAVALAIVLVRLKAEFNPGALAISRHALTELGQIENDSLFQLLGES